VASLNDAHVAIGFPSNFSASRGFTVDIDDGRVLVDSVNRALPPAAQFPFDVGDELVALDGQPVQRFIGSFGKYFIGANPRTTARGAAIAITDRFQQFMRQAPDVADTTVASVRLASTRRRQTLRDSVDEDGHRDCLAGPRAEPASRNGRIFLSPTTDVAADVAIAGVGRERYQLPDPAGGRHPALDIMRNPGLLGLRAAGAGGSNRLFDCTAFTEGVCSLTQALMNRGV